MEEGVGALGSRHTCLGIYAWQCIHVHGFGPVCCASVDTLCAHVDISTNMYRCLGVLWYNHLVFIPCVQVFAHRLSLRAYVPVRRSTHVRVNTRRQLGTHVT